MQSKPARYYMGKRQLIVVEWDDITTYSEWQEKLDGLHPIHCVSVGWQMHSGKGYLRLSAMRSQDAVNMIQVIPKGCIRKITRIKANDLYGGANDNRGEEKPA